jgi:sterol desaturase/sphingolipid hydroxylase (fatty acid hydroxylase superfamily)
MMHFLALQAQKLLQVATLLFSPASVFSLPELAVALLIAAAYLGWRQSRRRGAVRWRVIGRAMLSRRILFSRSTHADVFYFFVNTLVIGGLIGWALFSALAISTTTVHILRSAFGACAPSSAPDWALRVGMTLVAFIAYELAYYIDHYLMHKVPVLWELHKTHHTAEVLTPLTVFRVHPLDTLIFANITAVIVGLAHGVFTYSAGKNVGIYMIDNANIIMVAFLYSLVHLQHSQFWIPLRGAPGRILMSPAHHQIHHSVDPAHYNCNLGSCLAVWDWMFGTLSVPQREPPRLKFGVCETGDDPHRIATLVIAPIANALRVLGLIRQRSGG